ncbi:MAG: Calx-beta domain-containing protein, partial [Pyrinomonadaceae bacterium]
YGGTGTGGTGGFDSSNGLVPNVLLNGSVTPAPAPAIQVTGGPLNFGNQLVNTESPLQSVTVTNTGTANLVLGTPTFMTGTQFAFATNPNGTVVAPGNSTTVNFTFTPTSIGAKTDSVLITSNASGLAPAVTLNGTGINPPQCTAATIEGSVGTPSHSIDLDNVCTDPDGTITAFGVISAFGGTAFINSTNNILTFTPTSPSTPATYVVGFSATDNDGSVTNSTVTIRVNDPPIITEDTTVSAITETSATFSANAQNGVLASTITARFRYDTTNPGICNDSFGTGAPISGGITPTPDGYSINVTGLTPGTTYFVCFRATNLGGTTIGAIKTFTTDAAPVPGQFNFDPQFYSPNEADGSVTLTVTRTGGTDGAVSVDYGLVASGVKGVGRTGVAVAATPGAACLAGSGVDFVTPGGTLNFADGESSKTFNVTICDDQLFEFTENFMTVISNPTGGATIGTTSNGSVNILDNDSEPSLQFSASNFDVNENAATATVTVTRTGASEHALTVNYAALGGGTATAGTCGAFSGNDFQPTSGTLNFASGDNEETFTITICNDGLFEASNETIAIALNTQSSPAVLGTPNSGTVTIIPNNDPPSVEFSSSTSDVDEAAGTKTFTVNRTGATENSFTVSFATADGTALNGSCGSGGDYQSNSGSLSFVGGDPNKTFDVTVCDDAESEGSEQFSATLSNSTDGAVIGTNGTETVTINDNEPPTLVVNSLIDDAFGLGCGFEGLCTLRGAVSLAQDGYVITFDPALFGPGLNAPEGGLPAIVLNNTEIIIDDDISIIGPGANKLAVDGGPSFNRIFSIDATVTISGLSLVGGNGGGAIAPGSGGAVRAGGSLTLDSVYVHDNGLGVPPLSPGVGKMHPEGSVACGGGVALFAGSHTIRNSTFSGNSSNVGGGVCVSTVTSLTIENSTISGNSSTSQGGGVSSGGILNVYNSTITNNASGLGGGVSISAAPLTIRSSIISGNSATAFPEIYNLSGVQSFGFNMVGDSCNAGPPTPCDSDQTNNPIPYQTSDIRDVPHLLGLLQNNGGPTPTHALRLNSPAFDKGFAFGLLTDQRGGSRTVDLPVANAPFGDGSDIGAFESLVPTAASASISGRVRDANGRAIRGVVISVQGMDGLPKIAVTNTFGYYRIDELQVGESFVVTAKARRYEFAAPTQFVNLADDLEEIDFRALP